MNFPLSSDNRSCPPWSIPVPDARRRRPAPGSYLPNQLTWHIRSFKVGSQRCWPWTKRSIQRKSILTDVAGQSVGGEITAIMGASGAGKTTLLECLALRSRQFKGRVTWNGEAVRGDYFTASALVHQREVLCGFLTVEEHLLFHGTARMSDRFSPKEIEARVRNVIEDVGLSKCRKTLVGGPGAPQNKKGLSGGERKRLTIATELLLCPQAIFLDEPTTSLDSVMAGHVVALLRQLALSRRILVMATIHAPSSQIFSLFSHVLLLTNDGRLAFHGTISNALLYASSCLKRPLPDAYNPADHLVRLVVSKPGGGASAREERRKENDWLVQSFAASAYGDPELPERGSHRDKACEENSHRSLRGVQGQHASAWTLFRLNLRRGLLQTSRNSLSFWLYGMVMGVIGLCFGTLYFQQAASSWRNLVGLLYALVVALLYMCPLTVILRAPLDWPLLLREYFAGANAAGPYLLAKILYELPFAYGPLLLVAFLYWMTGLTPSLAAFLQFAGVVALTTQASCAMALMVGSLSANPMLTLGILPAFITPMVLFSGFLYDTATLPSYLAWLPKISIVNYGFAALITLQQSLLPAELRGVALKFVNVDPEALGANLLMLTGMTVIFYALTYMFLTLRLRTAMRA